MEVIILLFGIVLFVAVSMYFSIVNHCVIMGMNIFSLCFAIKFVKSDTIETSHILIFAMLAGLNCLYGFGKDAFKKTKDSLTGRTLINPDNKGGFIIESEVKKGVSRFGSFFSSLITSLIISVIVYYVLIWITKVLSVKLMAIIVLLFSIFQIGKTMLYFVQHILVILKRKTNKKNISERNNY